jgi:hypothetical protein
MQEVLEKSFNFFWLLLKISDFKYPKRFSAAIFRDL